MGPRPRHYPPWAATTWTTLDDRGWRSSLATPSRLAVSTLCRRLWPLCAVDLRRVGAVDFPGGAPGRRRPAHCGAALAEHLRAAPLRAAPRRLAGAPRLPGHRRAALQPHGRRRQRGRRRSERACAGLRAGRFWTVGAVVQPHGRGAGPGRPAPAQPDRRCRPRAAHPPADHPGQPGGHPGRRLRAKRRAHRRHAGRNPPAGAPRGGPAGALPG